MNLLSMKPITDQQNFRMCVTLAVLTAVTIAAYVLAASNPVVREQFAPIITLTDGVLIVLTARTWDVFGDLRDETPINPALRLYYLFGLALSALSTAMVVFNAFAR